VRSLLDAITPPARVPILVAQHIGVGFEAGYANWLGGDGHDVRLVAGPEGLEAGVVYVSPASASLVVTARGSIGLEQVEGARLLPSVDLLFGSLAAAYGERGCGVLLTGMGRDGAAGLLALRQAGAPTLAQSEASCAVFGMPRAARELGAVNELHDVEQLGRQLAAAFSAG